MKKNIIAIILLAGIIVGCSKDYLDAEDSSYLTKSRVEELKKESPEAVAKLVEASLAGVYNLMVDYNLNGNTSHDYFGLKAIHAATDLTGEDMVQVKHHHFGWDYNIDNRQAPYRRTRLMWAFFYKMISSCNGILTDFYSSDVTDPGLLALKSQILTLRGVAYYYLVNLYQQTYKGNENKWGVPLVLKIDDEKLPRATVQQNYDQIVKDLTWAVANGSKTEDKKDADQIVSATYLAKTYAAMEVWDSVAKYSDIAIKDASLMSAATYENSFTGVGNSEWIWAYDINATTTTLYASFYAHFDNTIPGYAGGLSVYKSMHNKLYEQIPDGDVRKKLFINKTDFPTIAEKYKALPEFAEIKYKSPSDFTGDYCFMRIADAYLLLAEAYAMLGKDGDAKTTLETFVKTRKPDYSTSGKNLIDEVRFQRRIELWGEGTHLFDMKRWKLGIKRNVTGTNHRTKKDLAAGAKDLVYQIPQSEIDANPNIQEQNP